MSFIKFGKVFPSSQLRIPNFIYTTCMLVPRVACIIVWIEKYYLSLIFLHFHPVCYSLSKFDKSLSFHLIIYSCANKQMNPLKLQLHFNFPIFKVKLIKLLKYSFYYSLFKILHINFGLYFN